MSKRKFKLPGIQDLSKEQEDARALPNDGQFLIIGGPGTGKSVLALLRARRYNQRKSGNYRFLVFNNLLKQASSQLFENKLESRQWQGWFGELYSRLVKEEVPRSPAEPGGTYKDIDWEKVLQKINDLDPQQQEEFPYLIIDEGQDMPPQFYRALASLGVRNFYVVADQNQQIKPDRNSTRHEIQDELDIGSREVIELQENYRNKYPIARFAREFYTRDPASPPPDLPASKPSVERPVLFEYSANQFPKVIERILVRADQHPERLIAVITPNNKIREKYVTALRSTEIELDSGRPQIETYPNSDKSEISFGDGGIVVINAQSCKGLEFDTVFIADINEFPYWHDIADQQKRLFYVMVARAIDRVILLKEKGKKCNIDAIIPTNPEILDRK
jgi:DNA helicase II / ATP-dependent DNA helicase PcrA